MGGGGVPAGRPSQAAYFVALAGIATLLLLLCLYFCYYFVRKVKELSSQGLPTVTPSSAPPPTAYPVQPVVREGATALARLCSAVPAAGKGAVFPAASSPPARLAPRSPAPRSPAPRSPAPRSPAPRSPAPVTPAPRSPAPRPPAPVKRPPAAPVPPVTVRVESVN